MPSLKVEPLSPGDLGAAAMLLAGRQTADRARLPALAAEFTDPATCAAVLRRITSRPGLTAVAAHRNGRLVGFLLGEAMLFGPRDLPTKYFEPRSISIPWEGHACSAADDPIDVYRGMYTALAASWARDGFFVHQVHITAGDPAVQEAWVNLGFGRGTTCAVRPTEDVSSARDMPGIEVHEAGPEDIDVVMALDWQLHEHHSQSPIFWPALRETRDAGRAHTASMIAEPANPHFVAYQAGLPVAMQTFEHPGFIPLLVDRTANVYLHDGIVTEAARGGGLGTMLLRCSMQWARESGHQWCTLHFASANPSGGPFWLGHGFLPVEYTMSRHLDERVAFANAW